MQSNDEMHTSTYIEPDVKTSALACNATLPSACTYFIRRRNNNFPAHERPRSDYTQRLMSPWLLMMQPNTKTHLPSSSQFGIASVPRLSIHLSLTRP